MWKRFFEWYRATIAKKPIKWQIYAPWYAVETAMIIWEIVVDVGPIQRDWRALLTLPFTTFPLFMPMMRDVTIWRKK